MADSSNSAFRRKHTFWGNKAPGATLSGGGWESALPLANMKNGDLTHIARSLSCNPADTRFNIDLGGYSALRGVMFGPTTISSRGWFRFVSTDETFLTDVYDFGWNRMGVAVPFGTLPWGAPDLYDGLVPWHDPDRAAWAISIAPEAIGGRYGRVEIDDPDNPAGFIDVACLFMSGAFVPTLNYDYGNNGHSRTDKSMSSETLDGTRHIWRRTNRRRFQCQMGLLPETEAFREFDRMLTVSGFDQDVFVVPDPGDAEFIRERSFLGRIVSPDPLSQSSFRRASVGFAVEEK